MYINSYPTHPALSFAQKCVLTFVLVMMVMRITIRLPSRILNIIRLSQFYYSASIAFCKKNRKTLKIQKFSTYGALPYYHPCQTNFPPFYSISYRFQDDNFLTPFFKKNGQILKILYHFVHFALSLNIFEILKF